MSAARSGGTGGGRTPQGKGGGRSPVSRGGGRNVGAPKGGRGRPPGPDSRGGAPEATRDGGRRRAPARGLGGDQVEGRQAVRELLLADRRKVREVWIATDPDDPDAVDDIAELAESVRVLVKPVSRQKLLNEARTEAPQGVLAKAAPLPELELEELATTWVATGKGTSRAPFLVCSDGITDPGNLGALIRSAECAGVTGIVLPRHRAAHVSPAVTKAAAGAIEHMPMGVVAGLPSALLQLRELGVRTIGLDMGGDTPLWDLPLGNEPVALVLGAEGAGLGRLVRQRCDDLVSIPLLGHLGSLNVAAAGVIACYEVARRRLAAG